MRKFLILASLAICCVAAPTTQQDSHEHEDHNVALSRPSPINPDVVSDPKPQEKITKITDPKEITKFKRETADDPYDHILRFVPTVQPAKQVGVEHSQESHEKQSDESNINHQRQKREKGALADPKKSQKPQVATPAPVRKTTIKRDSPNHTARHQVPKPAVPAPVPARDLPKLRLRRQVDPHLIGASAVPVTPLIQRDEDVKPQDAQAQQETHTAEADAVVADGVPHEAHQTAEQSQTTAATLESHEPVPVKRDIPVPLVPKYQHPEESPKADEEKNVEAVNNEKQHDNTASQPTENDVQVEQHQKHEGNKSNKSSESSESSESHESDEDSKEKGPKQKHQQAQNGLPSEHSQYNQPQVPAEQPHIEEPSVKPEQQIKPDQIISYEAAANDEHLAIKHPVPVAELFGRPKQ